MSQLRELNVKNLSKTQYNPSNNNNEGEKTTIVFVIKVGYKVFVPVTTLSYEVG